VDINVAFYPVLVPYSADVFPIRATTVKHGEYFAKKSGLDI